MIYLAIMWAASLFLVKNKGLSIPHWFFNMGLGVFLVFVKPMSAFNGPELTSRKKKFNLIGVVLSVIMLLNFGYALIRNYL